MSELSAMQPQDLSDPNESKVTQEKLEKLYRQCYITLGGTSIDVHLEDEDYETAFTMAVEVYRDMSSRSVYQTYGSLKTEPSISIYHLNERIDNVVKINRTRGLFGGAAGATGGFESFGAATANTLLRGGMGSNSGAVDLVTYDFMLQYQETLDRLFAREIHFVFRNDSHTLLLTQIPRHDEVILLDMRILKSINELLSDHWSNRWLREYTLAHMRIIWGSKVGFFATLPGAQGGTTTRAESMIQQGEADKQRLEDDLLLNSDSAEIPMPVRG